MNTTEKKTKVIYIISYIDKAQGFEWAAEHLDKTKFDLSFILLNNKPSQLADFLEKINIPVYNLFFSSGKDIPRVLWQIIKLFRTIKPDVIHTHMVEADIVGLLAGRITGVKKRVHTRHDANNRRKFHKGTEWIDKLSNRNATHIASISQNVSDILIREEGVSPQKIHLVYHGFDLERFEKVPHLEIETLKSKYNPINKRPVIGVVARYMYWKGIQYIIPAFKQLLAEYPDALLLVANAKRGDYKDEIGAMMMTLPPGSYFEIEFENNLFALYHLFDVFVHVPIDPEIEAFGQIYIEALAAGIPSVFTPSGIAKEFIIHEKNALLVDFKDSDAIFQNIKRLLEDKSLCQSLIANGKESVKEKFALKNMITTLETLYLL